MGIELNMTAQNSIATRIAPEFDASVYVLANTMRAETHWPPA